MDGQAAAPEGRRFTGWAAPPRELGIADGTEPGKKAGNCAGPPGVLAGAWPFRLPAQQKSKAREDWRVQKVNGIGGVFFRARDPKALTAWYETHLGIDIAGTTWRQAAGLTVFAPFNQDTGYFGRDEQQWMLCFRVDDLEAMIAQLGAAGIEALQKDEWNSDVGVFARIHDPEGNPIELWEPSAKWREPGDPG